jgi:hypothetical protein
LQPEALVSPITIAFPFTMFHIPHIILPFHVKPKTKDEGPPIITAVKNYEVNKHTNMHPQKPQTTFGILSPLKQGPV